MTKQNQLKVGQTYLAKVSGKMVTVSLDNIDSLTIRGRTRQMFYITNLRTGRKLVFKSATKFRSIVHNCEKCKKPMALTYLTHTAEKTDATD
jgi:hypothetical protein